MRSAERISNVNREIIGNFVRFAYQCHVLLPNIKHLLKMCEENWGINVKKYIFIIMDDL